MAILNYAQALAQAYPCVLHFAAMRSTENDARYKWTGANTIQTATRNFNNAWEPKTLGNHRKWSTITL